MIKLVHSKLGFSLILEENRVNELVVEKPSLLAEIVRELEDQCEGQAGGFILSEDGSPLVIGKNSSFVINPFSIDSNNRKILTKLYQDIDFQVKNELYEEQAEFCQSYLNYMDCICRQSEFSLTYNIEPTCQELLKMADVKIDIEADTLLERIVEHIKISCSLLERNIFVFLNLKLFLAEQEIRELYKECFYRKVHLILIEAVYMGKYPEEEICIVDKDACIIYP